MLHKQVQKLIMPLLFFSSPLNMLGSVRHSSSSLSSHTSSETGNLVILTDSSVGETAEDMYHMQVQLQHSQQHCLGTAVQHVPQGFALERDTLPVHMLGFVFGIVFKELNR